MATTPPPSQPGTQTVCGCVFLLATVNKSYTLSYKTAFAQFVYEIIACYVQLILQNKKKALAF